MPSTVIHEEVASFITKKINISSYSFYLGILAPDAPNLEGFAEKEIRWTAHLRKKEYDEWRTNLKDFYKNNKDKYEKDFILGYYIHILTDIIYDDFIYQDVRKKIMDDGYTKEDAHNVMRKDMDNYYFNELDIIKNILKENDTSYDIQNIDKELLLKFKLKCINNFKENNNSIYITKDITDKLNELVYKELIDELN